MIIPIKCYTCGTVLASKSKRYHQLMNHNSLLLKNNKIYLPSETTQLNTETVTPKLKKKIIHKFMLKDGKQLPIESLILDKIGLKRYCCRRVMMSHVESFTS